MHASTQVFIQAHAWLSGWRCTWTYLLFKLLWTHFSGWYLLIKLFVNIFQSHTNSLEDHGRQLAKNISDVASKLGGAKATGMLKNMMSSATSATFSGGGSNISSSSSLSQQHLTSPRRKSSGLVQDGTPISSEILDTSAVEAALMDAALDDDDSEKRSSTH